MPYKTALPVECARHVQSADLKTETKLMNPAIPAFHRDAHGSADEGSCYETNSSHIK
jgi:hypothetical protein